MQQADRILRTLAYEIRARPEQVKVAIDFFDEGATVPFVARYRKEATASEQKPAPLFCADSAHEPLPVGETGEGEQEENR
jgi:hypothetical protein